MYLKSLEITGFKSFPDKTVIEFGKGITAIVGPNGSGKSNISDAIRWVLGEQSTKTLRGGKMEDVIFAGTPLRKGASFAEVALTIDNSRHFLKIDYDEVIIARRYYRSGESDYFINKKIVRLKDVNELLMDTGLGRDGYSMIGQGRIDEVLSVKSNERRDMFEEAAGISKFKYRKEESERKLAATDDNLVRINDIIAEVEARYAPLEKKAEKAKSYLIYRDELRGLEISLWVDDLREARIRSEKAEKDYNIASFALDEARIASEKAYEAAEKTGEAMKAIEVEEEEKRTVIRGMEEERAITASELSSLETALRMTKENIERTGRDIAEAVRRREEIEKTLRDQERKLSDLEKEKEASARRSAELLARLRELTEKSDAKDARAALFENQAMEAHLEEAGHRAQIEAIFKEEENLRERQAAIEADAARVGEAYEAQKAAVLKSRAEIEEAKKRLTELQNLASAFRLRYNSRKGRADEMKGKLDKASGEKNAAISRRNLLSDMQRDYEGFNQAVRALMREKRRGTIGGIHGTVAELTHTERRYAVAIETALGGALQNIVTDNEESAKRAIRYLKENNAGRATFLPLTSIKPNRLNEMGLEREAGFVGVASELVTAEDRYKDILSNLLSRTVVAEDIDAAVRIAKLRSYRFRIVTLDGQIVNQGGSLTGGSLGRSGGILSRAGEIEELGEKIEKCDKTIEALAGDYKKLSTELDGIAYQIEVAEGDIRKNQDMLLEEETRAEAEERLLSTIGEQIERAEAEKAGITESRRDAETRKSSAEKAAGEAAKRAAEAEKQAALLADESSGSSGEAKKISDELSALSEASAASEAAKAELIRGKEDFLRILESAREAYETQNALLRTQKAEMEAKSADIGALEEKKSAEEKEIAVEKEALSALGEKRLELEGRRSRFDKQAREKNEQIIELEKECARLEMRKNSLTDDENRVMQNLWDNYELTIGEAEEMIGEGRLEERSQVSSRVSSLRGKIRALGEIDVGSIEEFKEVAARYEELTTQRGDIEKSKEELVNMIADITREMSQLFSEQFVLLNTYFNESFVEIFGGGSAELRLDDPNDVLTSGIEIVVRLPGKNLRTISLLSGGEKAFVAIALYFAILKTRPTPFCVLDEIEAALDDANVYRFARYMRKLTENTQFIVITHRRGTMENADILYGVTMQESGVSKLLIMNMLSIEAWAEEENEEKARNNKE